jgi:hypothetical protein
VPEPDDEVGAGQRREVGPGQLQRREIGGRCETDKPKTTWSSSAGPRGIASDAKRVANTLFASTGSASKTHMRRYAEFASSAAAYCGESASFMMSQRLVVQ